MEQLIQVDGLDEILTRKEQYAPYIKHIEEIIKFIKNAHNKQAEEHFISMVFMSKSVAEPHARIKAFAEQEQQGTVTKEAVQNTVYEYLSKLDSIVDYLDKLYKVLSKAKKYSRKADETVQDLNVLRNDVLHESLPSIIQCTQEGSFICCQMSNAPIQSNIKLQFSNGKTYSLEGLLRATYYPVKDRIDQLFENLIGK